MLTRHYLLFTAGLLSLFLSCIAMLHQQPFNIDGILYLKTSAAYLQGGMKAAMATYNWPFYSLLIAWLSQLTHLSLEVSAHLLNAGLIVLLVVSFIKITQELHANRATQYWATLVILIYPYLNHDRSNILRDFGYYAFALLSLLFLIRFLRRCTWRSAIGWNISILIATLFRIEGAIILCLAPFVIFLISNTPFSSRLAAFLKCHTLNFALLLIAIFLLFHQHHDAFTFGRIPELLNQVKFGLNDLVSTIQIKNTALKTYIFNSLSIDNSPLFLGAGLIGIFISTLIGTLTLLFSILSYHALRYRLIPAENKTMLALWCYIFLNVVITFLFLAQEFFLSSRYITLLCLLLMLAVPFSLNTLHEQWKNRAALSKTKKWIFPLVVIWLLAFAINALVYFGPSKTYLIKAGTWISQNTPQNAKFYTNDPQLFYYAHRPGMDYPSDFTNNHDIVYNVKNINFGQYDYAALVIYRHQEPNEKETIALLKRQPIQTFSNRHGDTALIFKK